MKKLISTLLLTLLIPTAAFAVKADDFEANEAVQSEEITTLTGYMYVEKIQMTFDNPPEYMDVLYLLGDKKDFAEKFPEEKALATLMDGGDWDAAKILAICPSESKCAVTGTLTVREDRKELWSITSVVKE